MEAVNHFVILLKFLLLALPFAAWKIIILSALPLLLLPFLSDRQSFLLQGLSNPFPNLPLAPEISREGFDHNISLTSAVLAAPLHFQVNPDPNPVSSSTSLFCVMICRTLQPLSSQLLPHISPSVPSIVRSAVPPINLSNHSQQ